MARTARITKGKTSYVDFDYPDQTFGLGGASFAIGHEGSDSWVSGEGSQINRDWLVGQMIFDDDELKTIVGGRVTELTIYLWLSEMSGENKDSNVTVTVRKPDPAVYSDDNMLIYCTASDYYEDAITSEGSDGESETTSGQWQTSNYITIIPKYDYTNALSNIVKSIRESYGLLFRTGSKSQTLGRYDFTAWFDSFDSTHPPYIDLVLEEVPIIFRSGIQIGDFVDRTRDIQFKWSLRPDVYTNYIGRLTTTNGVFRWRVAGDTEYTEYTVTGDSFTVPANTLGNGTIEWQVEIVSNAGTTAVSEIFTQTTIDKTAVSAPLSPLNQKLNRNEANEFKWEHSTSNGTLQTAADLQYSTDGVYWEELISVTGSEQSVIVPANSLPIGTVYWRVRTYNANGVAGEWSEPVVVLVEGSIVPVISSVSNEAFVNVMWTAELQQGYEIVIESENNIYKSGVQLGTEKQYRFKTPLADGSYTAKVRVYYNNGEASPWAEYPFTLSTEKPTVPIISATPIINGVKIDVISENDVYILRNGEVIGKAINGEFTDYAAIGENLYTARAVNESYNFADSVETKASAILVGSVIATADKLEETLQLSLNLNGQPQREFSWEQMGGITHYAGRKYPVYEHAEQESESYNFAFAFRTQSEYEKFMNLAKRKKPILYRDQYGLKVYGIITGVSPSVSWAGYAVTFSVTKIDYNEAVEYDL